MDRCDGATDDTRDAAADATLDTALDATRDEDWDAEGEIEGDWAEDMGTVIGEPCLISLRPNILWALLCLLGLQGNVRPMVMGLSFP